MRRSRGTGRHAGIVRQGERPRGKEWRGGAYGREIRAEGAGERQKRRGRPETDGFGLEDKHGTGRQAGEAAEGRGGGTPSEQRTGRRSCRSCRSCGSDRRERRKKNGLTGIEPGRRPEGNAGEARGNGPGNRQGPARADGRRKRARRRSPTPGSPREAGRLLRRVPQARRGSPGSRT
jgi:hypothetical protein